MNTSIIEVIEFSYLVVGFQWLAFCAEVRGIEIPITELQVTISIWGVRGSPIKLMTPFVVLFNTDEYNFSILT